MKRFPLFICAIVLVGFLSATTVSFEPQGKGKKQQKSDEKDKSKDKDKDKDKAAPEETTDDNTPKPLFQGNLGIKSSKQGKDSASLGFNGLDPEGHIEKAALNSPVTKVDTLSANALVAYQPTPAEFKQFIADGQLKAGSANVTQPDPKDKKK